ncbi:MAG: multicopper oxidase domain-containing protein [Chloroflexota bacterium]
MRDTTTPTTSTTTPEVSEAVSETPMMLPRRTLLKGAAVAAGGAVAASVVAATPAFARSRFQASNLHATADSGTMSGMKTAQAASPASSGEPIPDGWTEHDVAAREKVRRFVGNLAKPLGMSDFVGEPVEDPEFTKLIFGNQPLEPKVDGEFKVFDLTIDEIDWQIDAQMPPVKALGYNGTWPGPLLRVTQGDKVRANFKNNLPETTAVHFHGVEFLDWYQDGVPFVTQNPIKPGETYTYEFVAPNAGSMMYHSHHNATDQVGRGLLGAFIVDPKDPAESYAAQGVTQEVIFIHNDSLGGFTINGHGFPGTAPIVAHVGDKILIRYMNEGVMMHPWHTHGFAQHIVARDGRPLGTAAFDCDTLGVNPGERYDAIVDCDRPGVWAFHCHILPHVEGLDGMYGMVTALVILPKE